MEIHYLYIQKLQKGGGGWIRKEVNWIKVYCVHV
jgi:hypothetical protein